MTRSILRRLGYVSFFAFCLASLMLLGIIPIQEWFDVRDTKEEVLVELKEIEELNSLIGEKTIIDFGGNSLTSQSIGPKIAWFKKIK